MRKYESLEKFVYVAGARTTLSEYQYSGPQSPFNTRQINNDTFSNAKRELALEIDRKKVSEPTRELPLANT